GGGYDQHPAAEIVESARRERNHSADSQCSPANGRPATVPTNRDGTHNQRTNSKIHCERADNVSDLVDDDGNRKKTKQLKKADVLIGILPQKPTNNPACAQSDSLSQNAQCALLHELFFHNE